MMLRLKAPERRKQLMAVATTLFSQRGYDATTTAAIALAAGISEPVLYRHFENKRDLFVGVLRACTELLTGYWGAAALSSVSAAEQIRLIASSVHSALPEISDAQRVVYGAAATSCDPEVRAVLKEHTDRFIELGRQVVKRGQASGEFRIDFDSDAMAWAIINMYTGFSFTRLHFSATNNMDLRVSIELIVSGLLRTDGQRK